KRGEKLLWASTRNGTFASDGLRELTASLGLNTANFTEFQSQLMSNPDLMLQLLENPFIQSKLSSPDLMKKMATKSPQIRQVIQRAPEISHVFSSPEGMRLLLELARNPAGCAGNHQVPQDLKNPEPLLISVQSNTPGGDNPLRQLNSEVQEPGGWYQAWIARTLQRAPPLPPPEQGGRKRSRWAPPLRKATGELQSRMWGGICKGNFLGDPK
uniref:Uncharacterized protein n=1 Tax=Naja naja TaxID=35670 RepID=A0A8C6XWG1_NAJNA